MPSVPESFRSVLPSITQLIRLVHIMSWAEIARSASDVAWIADDDRSVTGSRLLINTCSRWAVTFIWNIIAAIVITQTDAVILFDLMKDLTPKFGTTLQEGSA